MQFTYVASVILQLTLLQSFTSLNISFSTITEFIKDVFGQTIEEVHEAGLVSPEMFDQKLEALHAVWDNREKLVPHTLNGFHEKRLVISKRVYLYHYENLLVFEILLPHSTLIMVVKA